MLDPKRVAKFHSLYRVSKDGCWLWAAYLTKDGYGKFRPWKGKQLLAHRAAYLMFVGEIPEGLYVCHHCDHPGCVRPDHLFLGTQEDNMKDAQRKGRLMSGPRRSAICRKYALRGENSPVVKYSNRLIFDIRHGQYSKLSSTCLARQLGMSEAHIRMIRRYQTRTEQP